MHPHLTAESGAHKFGQGHAPLARLFRGPGEDDAGNANSDGLVVNRLLDALQLSGATMPQTGYLVNVVALSAYALRPGWSARHS